MSDESGFSGVWLSIRTFHDDARNGDLLSRHYLQATTTGDEVVLQSLEAMNDSYLLIRLHIENDIATGSWQEQTAPEGYYQGALYSGACQFLIATDRKTMRGKWIAFSKSKEIRSDEWEVQYLGPSLPAGAEPILADRPPESAA